jgi:hypothetical protein
VIPDRHAARIVYDAIAFLRGIVSAQNVQGTDLIEIRVRHTNPEEARGIAKVVYEFYKIRREDLSRNPKYNAAIRHYHLPRKAFQTLGQHHWMQPTAAMKRLAHQSLAATV